MEIGTVVMDYTRYGFLKQSVFTPASMKFETKAIAKELAVAGQHKRDEQDLKSGAQQILAKWIGKISGLEMTDMFSHRIDSEVVTCEHHSNGMISKCVIKFTLKKLISETLN